MHLGLLVVVFVTLLSQPALASERKLYFGAGLLSQNTGRTSGGATGATGVGIVYPELNLSYYFPIGNGFRLSPWVLYTPMMRMSSDGGETSNILAWSLRLTKDLGSMFSVKLGLGELIYKMYGQGGTSNQNNGNGTATFALPTGTSGSTLFSVNSGIGVVFSETFRADIDLVIVNMFSNKRAFNTVLTVGYGLL